MSTLRAIRVWYLGPDAITPVNVRFVELGVQLAEEWSVALRGLGLQADRANLLITFREERTDDGAVHWRFLDGAGLEYEAGQVTLPEGTDGWSPAEVEQVLVGAARAVLHRMAELRGWDAGVVDRVVSPIDDPEGIPLVYDPPPAMFLWGGGGPTNDPRTRPYLDRNHEHVALFHEDPEWWAWWLALGREEADLSVSFAGRDGLRVSTNDRLISFRRVRTPPTIPRDPDEARALADTDLLEALARLTAKLDLPPHPPLR